MSASPNRLRLDYQLILNLVQSGTTVLDLGCGDGELLAVLEQEKQVSGQGIEIDDQAIYQCVARGLSVFHGDLDSGLSEYGDRCFDYVILNQSLQQVKKPGAVLHEALRVGHYVIVGFPNFVYWPSRLQIMFGGHTPTTRALPYRWSDTPNLHFMSISDFISYCRDEGMAVVARSFLTGERRVSLWPNFLAENAVIMIQRKA